MDRPLVDIRLFYRMPANDIAFAFIDSEENAKACVIRAFFFLEFALRFSRLTWDESF